MFKLGNSRIRGGAALLWIIGFLPSASIAQRSEDYGVTVISSQNVDSAGNSQVRWVMNFNPRRTYDRVMQNYRDLHVLFRDFGPERASFEINKDTLKISNDDSKPSISFGADVWGLAVSRNNRWQIELDPNEQITEQEGNRVDSVLQFGTTNGFKFSIINKYMLPQSAANVQIDKENHLLTYTLPAVKSVPGAGGPQVDVSVRYKKRLMAALYKLYGDPEAQTGAYWAAKTIFKNTGKAPIYDLKIYYRLGDYTEMSVPDAYSVVPAGGIVVDRYYPVIAARVAQLKTPTPLQLYIRYQYKDGAGRPYSNELTRRLEMLGINQFEFSNLNDEDRSDSWFDYFNNAPLLSAFVTRMDDVVKQFAGYVSERSGGAAANASDNDAKRWLESAYELERANHIVYQTPSGFLTPDHSSGQDIKFPRDVFRDKSGTCVDLAITYAALAEAVGLQANLMVVPGHTFAVITLPGGDPYPVENTGLVGGENGVNFSKAVEVGIQEFNKYRSEGLFYLVNVRDEWGNGRVPNPELPALGIDFLAQAGIRRMGGSNNASNTQGQNGSGRGRQMASNQLGSTAAPISNGKQFRVVHDHALNTLAQFCVGILIITNDSVIYQAVKATDGRLDSFEIKKSEVVEAKRNRMPMNQNGIMYPAFHIRLSNGVNFNFALLDANNRGMVPDPVLMEFMK